MMSSGLSNTAEPCDKKSGAGRAQPRLMYSGGQLRRATRPEKAASVVFFSQGSGGRRGNALADFVQGHLLHPIGGIVERRPWCLGSSERLAKSANSCGGADAVDASLVFAACPRFARSRTPGHGRGHLRGGEGEAARQRSQDAPPFLGIVSSAVFCHCGPACCVGLRRWGV